MWSLLGLILAGCRGRGGIGTILVSSGKPAALVLENYTFLTPSAEIKKGHSLRGS